MAAILTRLVLGLCAVFPVGAYADAPIVTTPCGRRFRGVPGPRSDLWAFRGIRYAQPPIGDLRWRFPRGVENECPANGSDNDADSVAAEVEDMSTCGPVCPQTNKTSGVPAFWIAVASCVVGCAFILATVLLFYRASCRKMTFSVLPQSAGEPLASEGDQSIKQCSCKEISSCILAILLFVLGLLALVAAWHLFWVDKHLNPSAVIIGSEDCLFLNVYAKIKKSEHFESAKKLKPVLVFIPGGSAVMLHGCDYGASGADKRVDSVGNPVASGFSPSYGAPWPALEEDDGFVAVSLNYRLNVFGFLHLSEQENQTTSLFPESANVGILDVMEALRWVRANIRAFGGDPDQVTLYGQSSGGTLLMGILAFGQEKYWTAKEDGVSTPLFHRVWSMSASTRIDSTKRDADKAWRNLFFSSPGKLCDEVKTKPEELRKCLLSKSTEDLMQILVHDPLDRIDDNWVFALPTSRHEYTPRHISFFPVVIADGNVVAENVSQALSKVKTSSRQKFPVMPTLIGTNSAETDLSWSEPPPLVWPFNHEHVAKWGNFVFGSDHGEKIWDVYKGITPGRLAYDELGSDIRQTCGNVFSAKALRNRAARSVSIHAGLLDSKRKLRQNHANVSDHHRRPGSDVTLDSYQDANAANVYNYVMAYPPGSSTRVKLFGCDLLSFSLAPLGLLKYPYHMWDLNLFSGNDVLGPSLRTATGFTLADYTYKGQDQSVAMQFRNDVSEFARSGRISRWDNDASRSKSRHDHSIAASWVPCVYNVSSSADRDGGSCSSSDFEIYRQRCALFEHLGALIEFSTIN